MIAYDNWGKTDGVGASEFVVALADPMIDPTTRNLALYNVGTVSNLIKFKQRDPQHIYHVIPCTSQSHNNKQIATNSYLQTNKMFRECLLISS